MQHVWSSSSKSNPYDPIWLLFYPTTKLGDFPNSANFQSFQGFFRKKHLETQCLDLENCGDVPWMYTSKHIVDGKNLAPPGMYDNLVNHGINYLSTGARFLPSNYIISKILPSPGDSSRRDLLSLILASHSLTTSDFGSRFIIPKVSPTELPGISHLGLVYLKSQPHHPCMVYYLTFTLKESTKCR